MAIHISRNKQCRQMYSNFLSKEFNKYEINFSRKTWESMKTKKIKSAEFMH